MPLLLTRCLMPIRSGLFLAPLGTAGGGIATELSSGSDSRDEFHRCNGSEVDNDEDQS